MLNTNNNKEVESKLQAFYILIVYGITIGPLMVFALLSSVGYVISSLFARLLLVPFFDCKLFGGYVENVKEKTAEFFKPLFI